MKGPGPKYDFSTEAKPEPALTRFDRLKNALIRRKQELENAVRRRMGQVNNPQRNKVTPEEYADQMSRLSAYSDFSEIKEKTPEQAETAAVESLKKLLSELQSLKNELKEERAKNVIMQTLIPRIGVLEEKIVEKLKDIQIARRRVRAAKRWGRDKLTDGTIEWHRPPPVSTLVQRIYPNGILEDYDEEERLTHRYDKEENEIPLGDAPQEAPVKNYEFRSMPNGSVGYFINGELQTENPNARISISGGGHAVMGAGEETKKIPLPIKDFAKKYGSHTMSEASTPTGILNNEKSPNTTEKYMGEIGTTSTFSPRGSTERFQSGGNTISGADIKENPINEPIPKHEIGLAKGMEPEQESQTINEETVPENVELTEAEMKELEELRIEIARLEKEGRGGDILK